MNISEAMKDQNLFGPHFSGSSWASWRAVLKGAFSPGSMSEAERTIYAQATGKKTTPAKLRELWLIVGRRGGKDAIASFLAVSFACSRDWNKELRPGETAVGMVICPDRRQGRVALGYMRGYLETIPLLGEMVEEIQKEAICFSNGIRIEIHTASFRSVRGYTVPFAILDELAFFRDESSANPDAEILGALKPAMATVTGSMLICISTPYARRGELWKAHEKYFGRDDDSVLVVEGPTQFFNPTVPVRLIEEAFEKDPIAAASEYGSPEQGIQFRSDVEAFVSREAVEACRIAGRLELPYVQGFRYVAFADPSGGSSDSFTLAIAHDENGCVVLDCLRERKPPFSPEQVTQEYAEFLKSYRVSEVHGDKYAGEWPREQFSKRGITYRPSERTKSEIYVESLPLLNSCRVELLDHPRLIAQLCGLERRTARGGRDSIDHVPGGHDDVINAAAGALIQAIGRGIEVFSELDEKVHDLDRYAAQWTGLTESRQPLKYISALDHAGTAAAFLVTAIDPEENCFALDGYFASDRLISEHASSIRDRIALHGKQEYTLIDPSAEDAKTNQNTLDMFSIQDAYMREGVRPSVPYRTSTDVGINLIKEYLRIDPNRLNPFTQIAGSPLLFISRTRCPALWNEMSGLRKELREGGEIRYVGADQGIDCLRQILMSRPKAPARVSNAHLVPSQAHFTEKTHQDWAKKWDRQTKPPNNWWLGGK